jgi:hypothetical protein
MLLWLHVRMLLWLHAHRNGPGFALAIVVGVFLGIAAVLIYLAKVNGASGAVSPLR